MKRTRATARLTAALALALLAGCATGPRLLRTDVTTFDDWSALPAARTYVFARTLEFQNSLEVRSYEDVARDELARQGFTQVAEPSQANLIVTLRPSVTSTRLRLSDSWPDPFFDRYRGFGGYGGYGGYYGGPYYSGGYGLPNAGWYGGGWGPYDGFGGRNVDLIQRRLEMDIESREQPGKRYYEGKVENRGEAGPAAGVMPYLVYALFADFPGNNGQTRRVDVRMTPLPARP